MANIKVNGFKELEKVLKQKVAVAMDDDHLGGDMVETVQKHIRDDVMAKYHPIDYQTTGDFHDSVISTIPEVNGNEITTSIEHDSNLMTMRDPWYHQSVIDGEDIRDALPEIIHEGLTYDLWNHGDAAYLKPRPYMENAQNEIQSTKKHVKKMIEHLRSLGLDAREG